MGLMLQSVQAGLEKNFARIWQEVRETGELSVLLGRIVRGQKLSRDERRQMTEQLKDLARVVPAIAIFSAPGGVFLLIVLARFLPFSLLPSAFREPGPGEATGPEHAASITEPAPAPAPEGEGEEETDPSTGRASGAA